jgi:GT2 family glycosyltransferase
MSDGHPAVPYEVDYVTGCALCVKREVIDRIGPIDPRFFAYYEETDWCYRARAQGYKIMVVPGSRIWHKVSATNGVDTPLTDYYMIRNSFLFLAKNLSGRTRVEALLRVGFRNIRTITSYTLKKRHRGRVLNRNAKALAMRDAILSRWGKMGMDVASQLAPNRKAERNK